ncbi:UNVERIFIED_CONTAM: hypothetical protein FKN15_075645 [Acipenser sinensis]
MNSGCMILQIEKLFGCNSTRTQEALPGTLKGVQSRSGACRRGWLSGLSTASRALPVWSCSPLSLTSLSWVRVQHAVPILAADRREIPDCLFLLVRSLGVIHTQEETDSESRAEMRPPHHHRCPSECTLTRDRSASPSRGCHG